MSDAPGMIRAMQREHVMHEIAELIQRDPDQATVTGTVLLQTMLDALARAGVPRSERLNLLRRELAALEDV